MMMCGMMGGMGTWMALSAFVGLIILVLGALVIAWFVRNLISSGRRHDDSAEQELRRRYAAGELSRDQYLEMSSDLRAR
jgi:putative membrane protein